MSSNNFQSIGGTSGVRITRRITRNWADSAYTPTSSIATTREVVDFANKNLASIEDETTFDKLTAKREKEAHERAVAFVRNQLLRARRDNWLSEPIEYLIGYTPRL